MFFRVNFRANFRVTFFMKRKILTKDFCVFVQLHICTPAHECKYARKYSFVLGGIRQRKRAFFVKNYQNYKLKKSACVRLLFMKVFGIIIIVGNW